MDEKQVVFGYGSSGLTFMLRSAAEENVAVLNTLRDAKNWGDVRRGMPTQVYYEHYLLKSAHYRGPNHPDRQDLSEYYIPAQTPFTPTDVFYYDDWTCFPSHAEIEMSVWMPAEVQARFGKKSKYYSCGGSMVPPGDILMLDEDREDEIVAAMQAHGFQCIKDDDLIMAATTFDIDLDEYPQVQ